MKHLNNQEVAEIALLDIEAGKPGFDITNEELAELHHYAESICEIVGTCRGDALIMMQEMVKMHAMVKQYGATQRQKIEHRDVDEGIIDKALAEFDDQLGAMQRLHEIHQAVNCACVALLEED